MSPAITTTRNTPDVSYDLFHDLQKSLKNPTPRHRTNNRINSTENQHHDLMMSSSKPDLNMTRWGEIPQLTQANYNEWKDDLVLILSAMRAYAIITGDGPEPQPLDFNHYDN